MPVVEMLPAPPTADRAIAHPHHLSPDKDCGIARQQDNEQVINTHGPITNSISIIIIIVYLVIMEFIHFTTGTITTAMN